MNKIKNIFKSIGIILLSITFSGIFFIVFNINQKNISDKTYLIYYTLSNLILSTIFILIYRKDLIKDLKKYNQKILFTSVSYWIIGFIIMIISNYIITYILKLNITNNEAKVRSFINTSPLLMMVNTCIFAPLTEELAYRKSMKDTINNKWIYIITSGLLFGLIHIITIIQKPINLVHLIPYGALGISFASLYHKTDNIYSTISMHAIHNLLAMIIYLLGVSL